MKTLKELIRMTSVEKVTGNADIEIKDVTADSRMKQKWDYSSAFPAYAGWVTAISVKAAVEKGASAIVASSGADVPSSVVMGSKGKTPGRPWRIWYPFSLIILPGKCV